MKKHQQQSKCNAIVVGAVQQQRKRVEKIRAVDKISDVKIIKSKQNTERETEASSCYRWLETID